MRPNAVGRSRRVERSKQAAERQAAHDKRTAAEQLALVDNRPGQSLRERAKLA